MSMRSFWRKPWSLQWMIWSEIPRQGNRSVFQINKSNLSTLYPIARLVNYIKTFIQSHYLFVRNCYWLSSKFIEFWWLSKPFKNTTKPSSNCKSNWIILSTSPQNSSTRTSKKTKKRFTKFTSMLKIPKNVYCWITAGKSQVKYIRQHCLDPYPDR